MSGVKVLLRFDHASVLPTTQESGMPEEEWNRYKREAWDQQPWFHDFTDKQGRADVDVQDTSIDRTKGAKTPRWRDLTGERYHIWVRKDESTDEKVSVVMKEGEMVKGHAFTVRILRIQQPQYVRTEE